MMKCRTDLDTRSNSAQLPVATAGVDLYQAIIAPEASEAAWRIVELTSNTGRAFGVELRWSGGGGPGPKVLVSAARSVRICVFARSLAIRVANRSTAVGVNEVAVTIADGFCVTDNVCEIDGVGVSDPQTGLVTPQTVSIPSFAKRLHVDVGDAAQASNSYVLLLDGAGVARMKRYFPNIPDAGLLVAEANTVQVAVPQGVQWRAVYQLAL